MDFHLLLLLLSVCLLSCSGTTSGPTVVKVTDGSEAVLPCFIRPERNITQDDFEWKKDRQNVFFYVRGSHYNNGLAGQDKQFKGRVSHFPEQLQSGNASIVIRNTKLSDSGNYTCDFSPDDFDRQRFTIELVVGATVVTVREGSEAVLPCLIRPERNITQDDFDWRKVVQKDDKLNVFHYQKGQHYNNNLAGQDEQFEGRVSHFQDQLQFSNASIRIYKTKLSDRGTYTCEFSPGKSDSQMFTIELVVGACSEPHTTQLMGTKDRALLQCYIRDASPKPEVKWQDSDGNILPAEEPKITERGGRFDVTLKTNVTKTGNYYCVAKQLEICHQIPSKTYVYIHGSSTGLVVAVAVLSIILLFVLPLVLYMRRKIQRLIKG